MNKFTDLQQKGIKIGQRFNLLEIALFEIYLMLGGFLACVLFSSLLKVHILVYIIIFLLGIAFVFKEYFTKNKNLAKRWERKGFHIHLLKDFGYLDFAIYKLTIFVFGIVLAKLFPQILSLNFVVWYTLIFGFGMGYFIAKMTGKEKKGLFGR